MDTGLFLITLFLGWFGIDKFYKGGKSAWKYFLVKLLCTFIFIGIIWNLFDLIQIARGKYELDFREYFA